MVIDLIVIGKTDSEEVRKLVELYSKRINRYVKFSLIAIPDIRTSKKLPPREQKIAEGKLLLKQFGTTDHVVLLDEKGALLRSTEFASWIDKRMAAGSTKRICFVVGGPYGFSDEVYERSNDKLSLSPMTFSHQIIRAIFAEQLYRAFAIINNEPYHNE